MDICNKLIISLKKKKIESQEDNFGKNLINRFNEKMLREIIAMFPRNFLSCNSHSVTYCSCFCVHSSSPKERVGGGYYCIRRVLGRHLAWYWSRNARILVRRTRARVQHAHVHTISRTLRGKHTSCRFASSFVARIYGGGDCLENGDRLSSIANTKKISLRSNARVCDS